MSERDLLTSARELAGDERERALVATGLGIIAAAHAEDDETGFYAAHGRDHSIFVLQQPTDLAVWEMRGPESARRDKAAEVRARMAKLGGDLYRVIKLG